MSNRLNCMPTNLQGALIEGYTNKVPKVVVGALDATLQILRCAGPANTAQQGDAPCVRVRPRHSRSRSGSSSSSEMLQWTHAVLAASGMQVFWCAHSPGQTAGQGLAVPV